MDVGVHTVSYSIGTAFLFWRKNGRSVTLITVCLHPLYAFMMWKGTILPCTLFCPTTLQPLMGYGFLTAWDSRSHSDAPHSVGLLWTSDQPDAAISTWQHKTLTGD